MLSDRLVALSCNAFGASSQWGKAHPQGLQYFEERKYAGELWQVRDAQKSASFSPSAQSWQALYA